MKHPPPHQECVKPGIFFFFFFNLEKSSKGTLAEQLPIYKASCLLLQDEREKKTFLWLPFAQGGFRLANQQGQCIF